MRTRYVNALLGAFAIAFILMLISIYISIRNSNQLLISYYGEERTYQVINKLETVKTALASAVKDTRGYFLTQKTTFIVEVYKDTVMLNEAILEVERLVSHSKVQLHRLATLKVLKKQRIGIMNYVISISAQTGNNTNLIMEALKKASDLDSQINFLLDRLILHERKILVQHQAKARSNVANTRKYTVILAISGLLIALMFIGIVRRDMIKSRKIQKSLSELNENKNKFFSIISHDLRGPILAAQKLSEFLSENNKLVNEDEKERMKDMLILSLKKAASLLNDLLEWSRVQMNSLRFNPEHLCVKEIVEETINQLSYLFVEKRIVHHNEIPAENCGYVDKYMMSTIIRNLISNAIKFSYLGGNIYIASSEIKNGMIEVSVRDEGVGIPPEIKDKLFQLGFRQTTKGTLQEDGTGYGLLLCKEFVEKQGGKIWVESTPGKGATFIFTIPSGQLSLVQITKESREKAFTTEQTDIGVPHAE